MTYKADPFTALMTDEKHEALGKALKAANKRIVELEKALQEIRNKARTGRPPFMSTKTDYFQIASAALEGNKDVHHGSN